MAHGLGMSLVRFGVAYDSSQIRVCNASYRPLLRALGTGGALPGRMLALPKAVKIAVLPSLVTDDNSVLLAQPQGPHPDY